MSGRTIVEIAVEEIAKHTCSNNKGMLIEKETVSVQEEILMEIY